MRRKRFKIKNESVFILIAILVIIGFYFLLFQISRPKNRIYYKGYVIEFRRNINLANKIPIENNCNIRKLILNPKLKNVNLLYFSNDKALNLIALEAIEITYKINLLYKAENIGIRITGKNVFNITSIDEIEFSNETLSILLISPFLANETKISCNEDKNLIIISGKNLEGFDLATIKFLLKAFGKL